MLSESLAGKLHADVAVGRVAHVVEVGLQARHAGVVGDDERSRRQPRLEQLQHLNVEVLPPVEQDELHRPVDRTPGSPARRRAAR